MKDPVSPEEAKRFQLLIENHQNRDLVIGKFISEAIPQAEKLYNVYRDALKKDTSYMTNLSKNLEKRKKAVFEYFDQNRTDFPLVYSEMIEDEKLYKLTKDQERRDFIENLVSKMLMHWLNHKHPKKELRNIIQKHV